MRTRATAVVVKENQLLMIHRFNHGEEYWVLPGGGVEEGESVEEAVLRELKEETSIEAVMKERLVEFTGPRIIQNTGANEVRHVLFRCEYISGEPKLHQDSEEARNMNKEQSYIPQWVDINRSPELTIYPESTKKFLISYLKKVE